MHLTIDGNKIKKYYLRFYLILVVTGLPLIIYFDGLSTSSILTYLFGIVFLPGVSLILVYRIHSVKESKIAFEKSILYDKEVPVPEIANLIAKHFKWKIINVTENEVEFNTSLSAVSFGERVLLIRKTNSDKNVISIISKPKVESTIEDFDKNKKNVEKAVKFLSQL